MKKFAYSILAVVLFIVAAQKVSAQSEESRQVSGFHSLASSGPFDVHVKIDGSESLKIHASAELLKQIETVVEDGRLEIRFKRHFQDHDGDYGKIDVYVSAKSLSSLANAGSGSIKVDGTLSGESITISLSGSGDIATASKSGELHVSLSGSGNIRLNGSSNEVKLQIAGSGQFNAKEFKTGNASINIAGSGSAYFIAEKNITASIVGSGSVVYSGNATVSNIHTIGSGSVTKAD